MKAFKLRAWPIPVMILAFSAALQPAIADRAWIRELLARFAFSGWVDLPRQAKPKTASPRIARATVREFFDSSPRP